MSELALIRCNSYEEPEVDAAIKTALKELGGIGAFVKPGQKVLLKVSLLMGAAPEKAITTHPALVKSVVKEVLAAGGLAFIGDLPGNALIDMEEAFEISGLKKVADETGAHLTTLKNSGVEVARLANKYVKEVTLSREVLEADVVISLPKLKTHAMTLITGAIKNLYGAVLGFNKSKYHLLAPHPKQLAELLVDIFEVVKPELTIMDAVVGMEGDGPANGRPVAIGAIIASPDAVAVDSVAAYLLGFQPEEILTTKLAEGKNLGVADLTKIIIKGAALASLKVKNFKRPVSPYNILKFLPVPLFGIVKFLSRFFKLRPGIINELCTQCGLCVQHCPTAAISQKEKKIPEINLKFCIFCFCCSEVCPVQAIKIKSSWLANRLALGQPQNVRN